MSPEIRLARVLRLLAAVLGATFAAAAVFAAVVLPYRFWDSLAFGSWSRSIAAGNGLWENAGDLFLQRPLFYVAQGLAWRWLGGDEWIGRLLSLSFAGLLAGAVWALARRLSDEPVARRLLPPLAVLVVLGSSLFARYGAAGMTDVPGAALVAATGTAVWSARSRRALALTAALAAAAVLAKPSALLAFAGLAPAALVLRGREAARSAVAVAVALAAGIAGALAYDAWQAARLDESLADFLNAGSTSGLWRERGAAARWGMLARGEWLGEEVRLLVLFGLVHGLARALGARPPVALRLAGPLAVAWSVLGMVAVGGFPGRSVAGAAAWLGLAAALLAAPLGARRDPVSGAVYRALLVWLAPLALVWWWQRADEERLLAPVWAPLVILAAAGLGSALLALASLRPRVTLVPVTALAVLALTNLPSVDGLGRDGWRGLLELGPSGWSDRRELENFAYGPFSYQLELARENVRADERVASSDGRLAYFFPGRVEVGYARACSDLEEFRFFSLTLDGLSREHARRTGQPTDPLGWLQCQQPRVQLIGEQAGIYAAFVVGGPPARPPAPEDCRISSHPGERVDAVFGAGLSYAEAAALLERALAVGFQGTRIERTSCSVFRVVVTGVPEDADVQRELRAEAESVGLTIELAPAVRYPEVPGDVNAVR